MNAAFLREPSSSTPPPPSDPTVVSGQDAPPEMDLDWDADDPTAPTVFVGSYRRSARPADPRLSEGALWPRFFAWLKRL